MPRSVNTVRVRRADAVVFDAIARHCWVNDPAWEPETLGVENDGGELRVGGRAVMTRREWGKVLQTTYEITALEPGRQIAMKHIDGPMLFNLDFVVRPAGPAETDVTVTVDIVLPGAMRLLTPVIAINGPGRNRRIAAQMVDAIEAATAAGGSLASAAA